MNVILFEPDEWGKPLLGTDERALHIKEILKASKGANLKVALLNEGLGEASVESWTEEALYLQFPAREDLRRKPELLPLELILGHPRPLVLQRLFKDLNSLGLARIYAVKAALSELSYLQSSFWKSSAWKEALKQGAQQGGLYQLSEVQRFWSLNQALEQLDASACKLCFDIDPACQNLVSWMASELSRSEPGGAGKKICFAIGPERGWTAEERELFKAHGFQFLNLGSFIMRTEAACVSASSVLGQLLQLKDGGTYGKA